MIRVNLRWRPRSKVDQWPTFVVGFLAALLVAQLIRSGMGWYREYAVGETVKTLQARLADLETRRADLFAKAADVMAVTGALKARNEWFQARAGSPVKALARIETSLPPGALLQSFTGHQNGGNLRFDIADLELGQTWVKGCFGQSENQMDLEDRADGRFRIQFSWTE